jgi:hypothetical protein
VGGALDGALWSLNLATGEMRTSAEGSAAILRVQVSPDGNRVAAVASDGTVRLFDRHSLCELLTLGTLTRVARQISFTADGAALAVVDGEQVHWWDTVPVRQRAARASELQSARPEAQRVIDGLLAGAGAEQARSELRRRSELRPAVRRAADHMLLDRMVKLR